MISGYDFVRIENPFESGTRTYCCGCSQLVPLDAVRWDDSGEAIDDYRDRIAQTIPFWERVRLSLFANAFEGAVNLGLDEGGRVVQPLRDPPQRVAIAIAASRPRGS
jgi:hypothetical protein